MVMASNTRTSLSDQTQKKSKSHKVSPSDLISDAQKKDIREAFNMVDAKAETEGIIETRKLKFAMRALGFEPRKEEVKKIISEVDKEGSGMIKYEDFLALMAKRITEKDTNEEIMKAFHMFDDDNTGKISFANLKRVAKELGENLSDEELREMITEADVDEDGEVNREEFLRIMKKTCLY